MKIFVIFLAIPIILTEAIVLECNFGHHFSYGYTCEVQNTELINSKYDREISEVRGRHLEGKSHDDVRRFHSRETKIRFFFEGLDKFFKNLEYIFIAYGNLEGISKKDLKPFGCKLKKLTIHNSKIEYIEADLFKFNKNLELIDLQYNQINHIENGVFDELPKLNRLLLSHNPCTSIIDNAYDDHSEVSRLISSLSTKCKDPNYSTTTPNPIIEFQEEKISNLQANLTVTRETLKLKIEENEQLKLKNSELDEKLKNCGQ